MGRVQCAVLLAACPAVAALGGNDCFLNHYCGVHGDWTQQCHDADAVAIRGDWVCRCTGEKFGVALRDAARGCKRKAAPVAPADECTTCPEEARVTERRRAYQGGELHSIPFGSLQECVEQCTWTPGCVGFTYNPKMNYPLTDGNKDHWPVYGNCVARSPCCWLKQELKALTGTLRDQGDLVSGVKGRPYPCASTPSGNACRHAGQECVDPTAGRPTYGDWQCRCAAPLVGAGVAAVADSCRPLRAEVGVDECEECVDVATATTRGMAYNPADPTDIVDAFTGASVDAATCAAQCTRAAECAAFTHRPAGAGNAAASPRCVDALPCCVLLASVPAAQAAAAGATAGRKARYSPCSIDVQGVHVCHGADQDCADPTAGTGVLGDWLCVCKSPRKGVNKAAHAVCVTPPPDDHDECIATPGIARPDISTGWDYPGNDIDGANVKGVDAEGCAAACTQHPECKAFTLDPDMTWLKQGQTAWNCANHSSCCWLKRAVGSKRRHPGAVSGRKVAVTPSAIDPATDENVCLTHGQTCFDPTAGPAVDPPVYGDWQCRCAEPLHGAAVGAVAPACVQLAPDLAVDECRVCPDVVAAAAFRRDVALFTARDAVGTIAALTAGACAEECTRTAGCAAFVHYPAGTLGGVERNCYAGVACCTLADAAAVGAGASVPGATSAAKAPYAACAVGHGGDVCGGAGQACHDPTAGGGTATLGDWVCLCREPQYGRAAARAATCRARAPALAVRECQACADEAQVTSAVASGPLAVPLSDPAGYTHDVPRLSADDCALECVRTARCAAYLHANASADAVAAAVGARLPTASCYGNEACCWLLGGPTGAVDVTPPAAVLLTLGAKAHHASCASGDPGATLCGDQACVDPTGGTEVYGDWQCRCVGPEQYGVRVAQQAVCLPRAGPAAVDECAAGAAVAVAGAPEANVSYAGADLVQIPLLSLQDCARECNRRSGCAAYSYDAAPLSYSEGACIPEVSCCWLKAAAGNATEDPAFISAAKAPFAPSAIDPATGVDRCSAAQQRCVDPTAGTEALGDWQCSCVGAPGVARHAGVVAACPTPAPTPAPRSPAAPTENEYPLDECVETCPTCANGACEGLGEACIDPANTSLSLGDWNCTCAGPYVAKGEGCTLKSVLEPGLAEKVDGHVGVGGVVSAVSTGLGKGGLATGNVGKLAVLKNFNCFIEDIDLEHSEPLDFEFHPFGLGLGPEKLQYYLGAVLCNALMVVVFSLLCAAVAAAFHVCSGTRWQKAFGWVRSPGLTYIPYLFALTGTSLSAAHLMLDSADDGAGYTALGVAILVAVTGTPVALHRGVLRRVEALAVAQPDPRLEHQVLLPPEMDTPRSSAADADGNGGGGGAKKRKKVEVYTGWKRTFYYLTFGSVIWVARDGCPDGDLWFSEMYGVIFEGFKVNKVWFVQCELVSILLISVLASIKPSGPAACHVRNSCICLTMLAYFVLIVAHRPYTAPFDNFVGIALALMMFLCVMLLSIALATDAKPEDGLLVSAGHLMLVSAILVEGKALWDLVTYLVDIYLERRSGARRQARKEQAAANASAAALMQLAAGGLDEGRSLGGDGEQICDASMQALPLFAAELPSGDSFASARQEQPTDSDVFTVAARDNTSFHAPLLERDPTRSPPGSLSGLDSPDQSLATPSDASPVAPKAVAKTMFFGARKNPKPDGATLLSAARPLFQNPVASPLAGSLNAKPSPLRSGLLGVGASAKDPLGVESPKDKGLLAPPRSHQVPIVDRSLRAPGAAALLGSQHAGDDRTQPAHVAPALLSSGSSTATANPLLSARAAGAAAAPLALLGGSGSGKGGGLARPHDAGDVLL